MTGHICKSNFGRTHECWCERNQNHSESDHKHDMAAAAVLVPAQEDNK